MLPLINSTPSEFALRFESRLCISKVVGHHIVPPTCMSRQPYLCSQSASLPPLSASILASPQRPHNLRYAHTPAQTHKPLHLPPLPTRRFSPILVLPCFPPHSRHRVFPRGQDFLQSLELINGKVAANDKLWEKDNKLEMHQCLSWPGMGANENTPPPTPLCPAAFSSYMCSHVSSDLYSLKQALKAVLLTKVPGDIFKFSLVA